ncbi:MAG: hypothetical protein ABJH63_19585 [Rhizobiaceae bacterium]
MRKLTIALLAALGVIAVVSGIASADVVCQVDEGGMFWCDWVL